MGIVPTIGHMDITDIGRTGLIAMAIVARMSVVGTCIAGGPVGNVRWSLLGRRCVLMFKDYIRHLSQSRFWISKWTVAAVVLGVLALAGIAMVVRSDIDFDTFLNYFALGLLIFVVITLFYGIIAIHDVPYEIAKHRNHPHQDAIHAAGWVSLFTLHAIWPFLWIWAMLYRPDRGWGIATSDTANPTSQERADMLEELLRRVERLEGQARAEKPAPKLVDKPPLEVATTNEPPKQGAR